MPYRRIIFHLILLLTGTFLFAGMSFYPAVEDMPAFSVSAITQDSAGAMWFGTRGSGVIKYNGSRYTLYTAEPFKKGVMPSNQVQCLLMETGDILWIGTYKGLVRLDTRSGIFTDYRLQDDVVCCIFRDSRDRLWAGTLGGLRVLDERTGAHRAYSLSAGADKNAVRGISEDAAGRVYACTYDGVFVYNERTDAFERPAFITQSNPLSRNTVYFLVQDADGFYWGASWETGLVKTDARSAEFTVYPLPDNRIYCADMQYSDTSILVGTWGGGLFEFFPETGRIESYTVSGTPPRALPNNTVYSLFRDSLGLLWVGTHGGGVVTYDETRSLPSALENDSALMNRVQREPVVHIDRTSDGTLWIAIRNGGLIKYVPSDGTSEAYTVKNGTLPNDMTYFCFEASDGTVYAGTESGLVSYDRHSDSFRYVSWYEPAAAIKSLSIVTCMMEAADGMLWIGTYGGGLVVYDPVSDRIKRFEPNPGNSGTVSDALIYFINTDSRGDVWLGTNNGLNKFDHRTGAFVHYFYDPDNTCGIGGNQIISFYENERGLLLFGTNGAGLSVFDPQTERFTSYTCKQGLPSNTVIGVLEAAADRYWITTTSGLCLFDAKQKTVQVYRVSDGLRSDQFSTAPLEAADGSVWFGTSKGVVCLPDPGSQYVLPGQNRQQVRGSRSMLTDVAINGVPLEPVRFMRGAPLVELTSVQRNVQIQFASPDYSPLARSSFSYQLKGFSDEWISSSHLQSVLFTNLSPGTYVFTVKNTESPSGVPDAGASFSFRIAVPFYKRWYCILSYAAAVCLAGYGAMKVRDLLLLRRRFRVLEDAQRSLQVSNRNLYHIANTDVLTGLHNRRGFSQIADTLWTEPEYQSRTAAFIMINIDYFKAYNDAYGYAEGDKLLCLIADAFRSVLAGNNGELCRYGGAEFLVLLPDCEPDISLQFAERLRCTVENLHVRGAYPGQTLITVTSGVYAGVVTPGSDWKQFVRFADAALYDAKNGGCNCVRLYTDGSRK